MRRVLWVLLLVACGDSGGATVDAAPDAAPDAMLSCDDHNTCTTDSVSAGACVHTPMPNCCGNGMVETGESCDDGNQADYDGCSSSCLYERALALSSLNFLPGDMGCDLTGDGVVDNAFGGSANDAARGRLSNYFSQSLGGCAIYVALFGLVGSDPTMTNAPFQFSFLSGVDTLCTGLSGHDTCARATSYFSGSEPFFVRAEGLDPSGHPALSLQGTAPGGVLATSRGSMQLVFPFCEPTTGNRILVEMPDTSLTGMLTGDATRLTGLGGRLCGAVTASSLFKFPNYTGLGGSTVLDVVVVGINNLGLRVNPTQPDIDVDGDGHETMADTDGDGNIDLCTDGNGTQIVGRDCPNDPRIADAYSFALDYTAAGIVLSGREP